MSPITIVLHFASRIFFFLLSQTLADIMSVPNFKLNNGIEMPAIGSSFMLPYIDRLTQISSPGLGCFSGLTKEERETGQTWFLTGIRVMTISFTIKVPNSRVIQSGYRYFDTAYNYGVSRPVSPTQALVLTVSVLGTEVFLGNAIKESGIPRKELFITTKLP